MLVERLRKVSIVGMPSVVDACSKPGGGFGGVSNTVAHPESKTRDAKISGVRIRFEALDRLEVFICF